MKKLLGLAGFVALSVAIMLINPIVGLYIITVLSLINFFIEKS